jgi:hypothetical protein
MLDRSPKMPTTQPWAMEIIPARIMLKSRRTRAFLKSLRTSIIVKEINLTTCKSQTFILIRLIYSLVNFSRRPKLSIIAVTPSTIIALQRHRRIQTAATTLGRERLASKKKSFLATLSHGCIISYKRSRSIRTKIN